MSAHCGTCLHHGFLGTENCCRAPRPDMKVIIIPRARWDEKRLDGSYVCSCKLWVDRTAKEVIDANQI